MSDEQKRKLTEMQQKFLDVLPDTMDIREAMKVAGYSDGTPISVILNSLRDEIIEVAKKTLAANSFKAIVGTLSVLEDPSQTGAANKLKAAQSILDRAGVITKEEPKDINLKVPTGGLIILPAKHRAEPEPDATNDDGKSDK